MDHQATGPFVVDVMLCRLAGGRGFKHGGVDLATEHLIRVDTHRRDVAAQLLLVNGSITAPVDRTVPLSEAAAALRHAEGGGLSARRRTAPACARSTGHRGAR
ncbi:MAG: hypothetical protein J0I49_23155 [Pseudonocardia sp.]|uniref:hypothetical protein n=1 Tax=Pseudonocardia sp. TaxID=60912 RepID=UPI001ACC175F|nr:hypothetical protein [Pseudonocardia sp.]MBN9100984.1 hypothetical protein [Pseudonocardia sp.]